MKFLDLNKLEKKKTKQREAVELCMCNKNVPKENY